jgi:prepilin-type N-terminal cleavage/methylation domain-containing protein
MDNRGFTLVELLVVLVVIGVLAGAALPRLSKARDQAFETTLQSDLRNLQAAQEQYYASEGYTYGDATALQSTAPPLWTESPGVTLALSDVSARGWAATASHERLPGTICRLHVGAAATAGQPDGRILCGTE